MNITIQIQNLDKLAAGFKIAPKQTLVEIQKAVNKSALMITENIKKETPAKTGTLRRGIRPVFGILTATISPNNAPYAIYVHEGTRPYTIYPVNKKALFWKGALHPVRKVNHPGIKPNQFMDRGVENSITLVEQNFQDAVDNVIKLM